MRSQQQQAGGTPFPNIAVANAQHISCLIIWEPVPANSPPADAFHRAVTFTELAFLCVYLIDIVMNYYAFGFSKAVNCVCGCTSV